MLDLSAHFCGPNTTHVRLKQAAPPFWQSGLQTSDLGLVRCYLAVVAEVALVADQHLGHSPCSQAKQKRRMSAGARNHHRLSPPSVAPSAKRLKSASQLSPCSNDSRLVTSNTQTRAASCKVRDQVCHWRRCAQQPLTVGSAVVRTRDRAESLLPGRVPLPTQTSTTRRKQANAVAQRIPREQHRWARLLGMHTY